MAITRLKITKLFGQFDYDIPLDNPSGLTILTGPNGYGKTMILQLIDNLFNQKFEFFEDLIFGNIDMKLSNGKQIVIENASLHQGKTYYSIYNKNVLVEKVVAQQYKGRFDKPIFTEAIATEFFSAVQPIFVNVDRLKTPMGQQKLNECATDLFMSISTILSQSYALKNELDASYPTRMIKEAVDISPTDYAQRFAAIIKQQEKLKLYGISITVQMMPEYDAASAKLLSVYLSDTEKKLAVFDDLLLKLDVFTTMLNNHKFSDKKIIIDKDLIKGFRFENNTGMTLSSAQLSTGEQHQVVLLFELIFGNKKFNANLILIDEPELSLHVAWQRDFLDDLIEIMKIHAIQVIIATHSPQIISHYSDLAYDLYESQIEPITVL